MRELAIYLIFFASLGSCFAVEKKNLCRPSNIKAQVIIKKKINQEIKDVEVWTTLPPEISIHSGQYRNLKFLGASSLKVSYKDKSGTKELNSKLDKDFVAKINLMKWFDEVYTFKGGELTFELFGKDTKRVCTYKMEITGGD